MATLYVTEYTEMSTVIGGGVGQMPLEPPLAEQAFSFTGTHAESNAFTAQTKFIRVHTDTLCSVLVGTAPVATTSSGRMVAGQTEYRSVPVGKSYMISAIINT